MQENTDGCDEGASGTGAARSERILESPDPVKLSVGDRYVGWFEGPVWVREVSIGGIRALVFQVKALRWSPVAAINLLGGMPVFEVFAGQYVLLGGNHRPAYDRRPGVDNARVAQILENPNGLDVGALSIEILKALPSSELTAG